MALTGALIRDHLLLESTTVDVDTNAFETQAGCHMSPGETLVVGWIDCYGWMLHDDSDAIADRAPLPVEYLFVPRSKDDIAQRVIVVFGIADFLLDETSKIVQTEVRGQSGRLAALWCIEIDSEWHVYILDKHEE